MSSFKTIPLSTQLLFILFILLLGSSSVFCEWSDDPFDPMLVFDASRVGGSSPEYPYIIPDGEGGCIIAWHERNLGQIRMQKIDRRGRLQWDEEGITIRSSEGMDAWGQHFLMTFFVGGMISDGEGGAIVVWHDYQFTDLIIDILAYNNELYAKRIDDEGEVVWGGRIGLLICDYYPRRGSQRVLSRILSDGEGGCVFAWNDELNPNDRMENGIYVQRISHEGRLMWDDGIRIGTEERLWEPYIWSDERNGMYVTTNEGYQLVNSDGELEWDEPFPLEVDGWRVNMCFPGPQDAMWCDMSSSDEENFRWDFTALNLLLREGELHFDMPGVSIIMPDRWDSLSYSERFICDSHGGSYVLVKRIWPPHNGQLRLQRAFHVDAQGNHLWSEDGIHLPFDFDGNGIGTSSGYSDLTGFYMTDYQSDEIRQFIKFKVGYNGDFLWGNEGILIWADSTGGRGGIGPGFIDEFGNEFRVVSFQYPNSTYNLYAYVVSAEGELGGLEQEIHYRPSNFSLVSPANGDTLDPIQPIIFTWEPSVDLNEADTVAYRIWFQVENDSISCLVPDTSFIVQLDNLLDDMEMPALITWWVTAMSPPHTRECRNRFQLLAAVQNVLPSDEYNPYSFQINSIYPNPFNSQVTIRYSLRQKGMVKLSMIDPSGRQIRLYNWSNKPQGNHKFVFDCYDLPTGLYFIQLSSNNEVRIEKIICLK
ncbi:MAG: T9SS type A sorting domain-containing protein [Candidatus Hatepunaea meridiana]|nr:T9SS type A sorting domain-containing protein [Candidatus Hatepunaea meridiana]